MVTQSPLCHLRRCALFVLGPICAEVAGHVAMRSLPCHMGSSYLARLTGNGTQDLSKEVPSPLGCIPLGQLRFNEKTLMNP